MTNEKAAVDTNIFRVRAEKLEQSLEGIASCATQCPCCEMHRRIANKALGYDIPVSYTVVVLPQKDAKAEALAKAVAEHLEGVKIARS